MQAPNIMRLATPHSAILCAVIFNALQHVNVLELNLTLDKKAAK